MNIIILCGQFYPNPGAPVSCFMPYLKELQKTNNIWVVSRKTNVKPLREYYGEVKLIELTTWFNTLRFQLNDKIRKGKNEFINTKLLNLIRIHSAFRTSLCYPTQHSWLIKKYYKKIKEIEKNAKNIDVIISISFPLCAHIAALNYKKKNPNVKWITYSTDPFTYNVCQYEHVIFKECKKKWAYRTEKDIYDNADANIVTDELYKLLLEKFHQLESKVIAFPYLITPNLHSNDIKKRKKSDSINCVYAGSLYIDIRNPKVMIDTFSHIKDVTLTMYADGDLRIRQILNRIKDNNIIVNGMVERNRYEEIIREEADILVNIGNTTELQSPSKLLELVSTGKPVLNFYSKEDFGYQIIDRYPLGLNVPNDTAREDSAEKVRNFCMEKYGKILPFNVIKELYSRHILENQMTVFHRLMEA